MNSIVSDPLPLGLSFRHQPCFQGNNLHIRTSHLFINPCVTYGSYAILLHGFFSINIYDSHKIFSDSMTFTSEEIKDSQLPWWKSRDPLLSSLRPMYHWRLPRERGKPNLQEILPFLTRFWVPICVNRLCSLWYYILYCSHNWSTIIVALLQLPRRTMSTINRCFAT